MEGRLVELFGPPGAAMKLRSFKTSDREWQTWASRARRANMSLSAWIRLVMNEREALEVSLEKESDAAVERA